MRSTLSVLAAALLVLAASTGCGDDDDRSGSGGPTTTGQATEATTTTTAAEATMEPQPEPPPDQSRWAMAVDDACEPVQRQINALPQPTDAASLERWVTQVLPLVRELVAAVKSAQPPAAGDEAKDVTDFVDSLERLESSLTRYLAALRKSDTAAIEKALADANAAGAQARTYAVALDVTQCGGYSGS